MTKRQLTEGKGSPYRRVVAKFGTNLLTRGSDRLDQEVMRSLVEQVAHLHGQGLEIIVVSSGAIGAGRQKLGRIRERHDLPFKQVLASVGQGSLIHTYEQLFAEHNITIAQALLTRRDLADRAGYLNARNTLLTLMELGVVCIVNENDVVATDEIEEARFGDNDSLSALVANLVDADLLVILTDAPGLCTADPHRDPQARLITRVERIDDEIERLASDGAGHRGTGGMATKLEAARLATASGTTVVVACGWDDRVLPRLVQGEAVGTLFLPTASKLESRGRWLLSGLSSRGRLVVDEGAATALRKQKRSLLPAGIREVYGSFERGEVVNIHQASGERIACGITNYSSGEVARIKGVRSQRIAEVLGYEYGAEVVHRNNLVVL